MAFSGTYETEILPIKHAYKSDPIEVHFLDSGKKGPSLLILAGVHAGTEPVPTVAAQTLITMILQDYLTLENGKVTIVPVANPLALEKKERFVDINLNRVFRYHDNPAEYEKVIANALCPLIEQADMVIDMHTQSTITYPFCFDDYPDCAELALATKIPVILKGWPEMFEKSDVLYESTCCDFAHSQNIPSVCVECGYNNDPMAASVAIRSVLNVMRHYKMTPDFGLEANETSRVIHMKEVISMPENGQHADDFSNLTFVTKGTPLIKSKGDGTVLKSASYDCILLLPRKIAEVGTETFYLGIEENA